MITVLYGLASAISWGTWDFSGGFATKTSSVFGMLLEGAPSRLQITGFLFAFAAIWLLSASHKSREIQWQALGLPIAAGLSFGLTFIFIDQASEQTMLWPLIAT